MLNHELDILFITYISEIKTGECLFTVARYIKSNFWAPTFCGASCSLYFLQVKDIWAFPGNSCENSWFFTGCGGSPLPTLCIRETFRWLCEFPICYMHTNHANNAEHGRVFAVLLLYKGVSTSDSWKSW